ncbi:hypothetical protein [Paenibacillus sp. MMS20-IR301]|nr:hypothetical protein [Paenibacillus sp. MMS20-IR301]WNS43697.1 hypothetical protein LOS79_00035 [Paenibacillus sp. MMS20-IR301]
MEQMLNNFPDLTEDFFKQGYEWVDHYKVNRLQGAENARIGL